MLASTGPAPDGEGWVHEVKWDGMRAQVRIDGQVTVRSRPGRDCSREFPELAELAGHPTIVPGSRSPSRDSSRTFSSKSKSSPAIAFTVAAKRRASIGSLITTRPSEPSFGTSRTRVASVSRSPGRGFGPCPITKVPPDRPPHPRAIAAVMRSA